MQFSDTALVQLMAMILLIAAIPGGLGILLHIRALEQRVEQQEERIGDLESIRLLDAAERERQNSEMTDLRRGVAILVAQLRRAKMEPEWSPAPLPAPFATSRQQNATERQVWLWQLIAERFDVNEQSELWFEMGWQEDERGATVGEKARQLVAYAHRHGALDELVALCRVKRPYGGF